MAKKSLSMLQIGLIGAGVLALGTYLLMGAVLGDDAKPTQESVEEAPVAEAAAPVAEVAAPAAVVAAEPEAVVVRPGDSVVSRSRSANLTGTEPVAAPRAVATGATVAYADLGPHVGTRVQVTTKMGTVRHGTLLSTNAFESYLQLDADDGGFKLRVPADSVAEVRLIPGG